MQGLIDNLEHLSLVELAELLSAVTATMDRKNSGLLALVRPPASPPTVTMPNPDNTIYGELGGDNALSRIGGTRPTDSERRN